MPSGYLNLSKEELKTVRTLTDDPNIVIKKLIRVHMLLYWAEITILQKQKVNLNMN